MIKPVIYPLLNSGSAPKPGYYPCKWVVKIFISALILFSSTSCSLPGITVWEDPLSPREHLQLGLTYEKQGDLELAKNEYEQALKEIPEAHLMLGNIYFKQLNYDKSEKHYRLAIKKMPDNPAAYNNLAWLFYTQEQNLEEAQKLAEKALILSKPGESAVYEDTLEKIRSIRKID